MNSNHGAYRFSRDSGWKVRGAGGVDSRFEVPDLGPRQSGEGLHTQRVQAPNIQGL